MTISKELESTIQLAFDEARRRRHEFVTLEHWRQHTPILKKAS